MSARDVARNWVMTWAALHTEAVAETAVDDLFALFAAAGFGVEQGWQPIETAPHDRLVEIYAPSPDPARWHPVVHDLPPIVCLAQWHPDAGFCVCEIREVTHWREHVPPKETGDEG